MRTNSTYRTKDAVAVVLLGSAIITISLFFCLYVQESPYNVVSGVVSNTVFVVRLHYNNFACILKLQNLVSLVLTVFWWGDVR